MTTERAGNEAAGIADQYSNKARAILGIGALTVLAILAAGLLHAWFVAWSLGVCGVVEQSWYRGCRRKMHKYAQGAQGERIVARELDNLIVVLNRHSAKAKTFHDIHVPMWKANIDSLIISAWNPLTVNAKYFDAKREFKMRGDVLYCGNTRVDVATDKAMAAALGAKLGVFVDVAWVVIGPKVPNGLMRYKGVYICDLAHLAQLISGRGALLPPAQSSEAARVAENLFIAGAA